MGNPKQPLPGDLSIDATVLAPNIVDKTKGSGREGKKLRDGYEKALACLQNVDPSILKRAGIDPARVQEGTDASNVIDTVNTFQPAATKMVELFIETKQDKADVLADVIEEAAAQAKRRAKKDKDPKGLLAALEPVLLYQGGPAAKAVKTKIKDGQLQPKPPKNPTRKKAAAAAPAAAPAPAAPAAPTPAKA